MLGRLRQWFASLFGGGERAQQHREIIQLAKEANSYPDNERLILRLGDCYLRAGDKERCLSAYWHVVDLYKKRHDYQKSAAVLKRIVVLAPTEMMARFELATCFEKLERRREAAQQWELAAASLEGNGDGEGAVRAYQRALALDPLATHNRAQIDRLRPPDLGSRSGEALAPDSARSARCAPRLLPMVVNPPKIAPPKPAPTLKPATPPKPVPQLMPAPATPVKPNLASLGRAQVREEVVHTVSDDPLDAFDLGVDGQTTTEYSAEDLGTLLQDFDAETVAVESLPAFDEEHRPADTPADPPIL
jgi:tetratricopeptide (TPR) repeat protein